MPWRFGCVRVETGAQLVECVDVPLLLLTDFSCLGLQVWVFGLLLGHLRHLEPHLVVHRRHVEEAEIDIALLLLSRAGAGQLAVLVLLTLLADRADCRYRYRSDEHNRGCDLSHVH
jgi:hypothetical protein